MTRTAGRTQRELQDIALADGRHIRVDGTYNLRDVGGYPTHAGGSVAWRTLLRSDSLHRLDSHSVAALAGLGDNLIAELLSSPAELILNVLAWARAAGSGSVSGYLTAHGVGAPDLAALRSALVPAD